VYYFINYIVSFIVLINVSFRSNIGDNYIYSVIRLYSRFIFYCWLPSSSFYFIFETRMMYFYFSSPFYCHSFLCLLSSYSVFCHQAATSVNKVVFFQDSDSGSNGYLVLAGENSRSTRNYYSSGRNILLLIMFILSKNLFSLFYFTYSFLYQWTTRFSFLGIV